MTTERAVFDTPSGKIPMIGQRGLPKRKFKVDLSVVPQVAISHPEAYWQAIDLLKASLWVWVGLFSDHIDMDSEQAQVDEAVAAFDESHPDLFGRGVKLYDIISFRVATVMYEQQQNRLAKIEMGY